MKKFNTILAIATVAISSVFGLTSCDKDDDPISQAATPQVVTPTHDKNADSQYASNEYNIFISDNVLAVGDYVFTVENGDRTSQCVASEGTAGTKSITILETTTSYAGKTVTIKGLKHGAKVTAEFVPNTEAINALPVGEHTKAILIISYVDKGSDGKVHSSNDDFTNSVKNENVLSYLTLRANSISHTFSN